MLFRSVVSYVPVRDAGGKPIALLVLGMGLLMIRVWPEQPRFSDALAELWRERTYVLWTALGILVAIFVLLFSNFFTYPRGILDGMYQGLAYWLGSQHEFARGKQPWYYYLMLLPVYEPIALLGAAGAASLLEGLFAAILRQAMQQGGGGLPGGDPPGQPGARGRSRGAGSGIGRFVERPFFPSCCL